MEIPTLKADRRVTLGTKASRRLRQAGSLPGIIYGHGEAPEPIVLPAHDMQVHLHHGVRMLKLNLGSKQTQCLIKDVQYDHLDKNPIHVDLARVDMEEMVTVKVGIMLRGTPKGAEHGGLLEQTLNDLEVECRATDIPEMLHPNVAGLDVGDALLVKDLELPPGVKPLHDPEEKVAVVRHLAAAPEPTAGEEEEEGTAEPEVIGRAAEKGQDEEESGSKSS